MKKIRRKSSGKANCCSSTTSAYYGRTTKMTHLSTENPQRESAARLASSSLERESVITRSPSTECLTCQSVTTTQRARAGAESARINPSSWSPTTRHQTRRRRTPPSPSQRQKKNTERRRAYHSADQPCAFTSLRHSSHQRRSRRNFRRHCAIFLLRNLGEEI